MAVHSTYLKDLFAKDNFGKIIISSVKFLKAQRIQTPFDAIACTGLSGCLVAPTIAWTLGVTLIVVRKPQEKRHASAVVEGADSNRYIVVDDFISSGATIRLVMKEITESVVKGTAVGIFLWRPGSAPSPVGVNVPIWRRPEEMP